MLDKEGCDLTYSCQYRFSREVPLSTFTRHRKWGIAGLWKDTPARDVVDIVVSKEVCPDILAGIRSLPNLERFTVRTETFGDDHIGHLAGCATLKSLYLRGTSITDVGMETLATLPNLEYLNLACTRVSDSGLENLTSLKNLQVLVLNGTSVGTRSFVETLPRIKTLRELHVSELASLDESAAVALAGMNRLETLDLAGTALPSGSLSALSKSRGLRRLLIRDSDLAPSEISEILRLCPWVEVTVVDNCTLGESGCQVWRGHNAEEEFQE
jgi:hypothetical protein